MEEVAIVAAAQTAVAKLGGTLAQAPAPELSAAVKRARLPAFGWASTSNEAWPRYG